jgi:hypothetical protein
LQTLSSEDVNAHGGVSLFLVWYDLNEGATRGVVDADMVAHTLASLCRSHRFNARPAPDPG